MQKSMLFAAMAIIAMVLQAGTSPATQNGNKIASSKITSAKVLLSYTWFLDENMTDCPTGTVSAVNTEISRLRNLYPGYIFSASPGFGLSQFEFGYHAIFIDAVIYSNLNVE
jgi:hypothetical protein